MTLVETPAADLVDNTKADVAFATISHVGTVRALNEDACGARVEGPRCTLLVVADGVSGREGGEIASQTAVEVTIREYTESPESWGPSKRLYRSVQRANIEIHDRAMVVPELRGMSTTLTAAVIDQGILYAAHVGDSRLYLLRDGKLFQKTKDHTVAAERMRMGLISAERARQHPDRSTITRSVGTDLIAAVDRITFPLAQGDVVLICTDGLYNVLDDDTVRAHLGVGSPTDACELMVRDANTRGTPDNLTLAVAHVVGATPEMPSGWRETLRRMLSG